MEIKITLLGLFASLAFTIGATQPENVVISDAVEEYSFVETPKGMVVKALEKKQYEATRHSETVYPHVYYDNVVTLDKVSGGKAQYRSVNDPMIFHDDSHICYFKVLLKEKGATAKTEFRRTFTDVAYFSKIFLGEEFPVRSKLVKVKIPASCPNIEIVGMNLPEESVVRNDFTNPDGTRVVSLTISDMPAEVKEEGSPALLSRSPYIIVKGYFEDAASLARFHSSKLDVDRTIPDIDNFLAEITKGETEREGKISSIYKFVQQKIRYVAFEEGEAGYRPDAPSEVIRKRFGDCKGMAMLLATLLNGAGIEAYVASVGTRRIPFRISDFPTLAATNHMICVVPEDSGNLFLDATNQSISMYDVPYSIQGKDAMMFKDDGFEMVEIPVRDAEWSSDEAEYEYAIEDGLLSGTAVRRYKGDMLEMFKFGVDGLSTSYKKNILALVISPRQKVKVDQEKLSAEFIKDGVFEIKATLEDGNAVTDAGSAMYVDLNTTGEPLLSRVDVSDRKTDYELPFKAKIVRRSVLKVPDGYSVGKLPEVFATRSVGTEFSCEFAIDGDDHVVMVKKAVINDALIPLGYLPEWNKAISDWNEACNHQIELLKN